MSEDRIAVYIRLSNADEDTGKGKEESNSVVNQRSLIHGFLDSSSELAYIPRQEFVDDGFSGTNTDRPAFQDMIRQIREGRFNVCITKDFSRFSRDYIEMGDYLECVFPFLKVRYISINDNYDSNDYKGSTGGLDVVLRSIVYDAYSKDLSVKVRTAQIQSAKKGRRVHGLPAFGYMPDPDNKAMDIIDPEAARIVRRIFEAAISGMEVMRIADMLNRENVITPGEYFRKKHPESRKFVHCSERQCWDYHKVSVILDRYSYTGAAVNMMRGGVSPCQKHTTKHPREEWIIVPGMHEAIVSVEEFEKAQKVIVRKTVNKKIHCHDYPLKSKMACGICGRIMRKSNHARIVSPFYVCRYADQYGNAECMEIKSPQEDELERIVYDGIMRIIHLTEGKMSNARKKRDASDKSFRDERRTIEGYRKDALKLYEQYASDVISKEAFLDKKAVIDGKIRELEQKRDELMQDKQDVLSELEANCRAFSNSEELTSDMVRAFVDKIYVFPDQRIEIRWRFKDCFDTELAEMKED